MQMRIYTTGELFGGSNGMKCEDVSGCDNRSWSILLSDIEYESLPPTGAIGVIFKNKLGTVLCDDHMKLNKK